MNTSATQSINGVDVTQLDQTIQAIRSEPELARFRFRAETQWRDGGAAVTHIREFHGAGRTDDSRTQPFVLEGDEPPVLLGSNRGPNAVEATLHALASCLAVGFVYNAAAQGITVRDLRFETEGELDLHGFLGLRDDVRPGYSQVRVSYEVNCDAPPERVDELCAYAQRTSPVLDMLRNPVSVDIRRAG